MTDKRVEVKIKDMSFYVVGDENAAYIKRLASNLNSRLNEIERKNYRLNQIEATILTALNILDELEKERENKADLQSISGDQKAVAEKINELKELRKEFSEKEKENKQLKDNLISLSNKLKKANDDITKKTSENFQKNDKIVALNKEIEDLKKTKESLQGQNQEAQKKIIDLNRELESIYNEK